MKYLIGAVAGLIWGSLAALLNAFITKKALNKGNDKLLLASNALRMLVDVAALGTVFLLRKVLPFSFEAALVGTAAALSLLMIVFAYKMAAGKLKTCSCSLNGSMFFISPPPFCRQRRSSEGSEPPRCPPARPQS